MSYSKKAVINKHYVKANGCSAISLRVIINRKRKDFDLNLEWPKEKFDNERGLCLARQKNDPDHIDYNEFITKAYSEANEIFKRYRYAEKEMTIKQFEIEWNNRGKFLPVISEDTFTGYYLKKITEIYKRKEISETTFKGFKKTFALLRRYSASIDWNDFHPEWANEFDAWMKKNISPRRTDRDTSNSRWYHHKHLRRLMKIAMDRENIQFVYPYKYFQFNMVPGTWKPIYEKDAIKIYDYYKDPETPLHLKRAARAYIFGLGTGLRRSDLRRVKLDWLKEGMLVFMPQKMKKRGKYIEIPLEGFTIEMFMDALKDFGPEKPLFADAHENTINERFRHIAKILEIKTRLHYHTTRHTFITLFLKNKGPMDVLMEYTGITDYKTIMKYDHVDQETKRKNIKIINEFLKSTPNG